MEVRLRHIGGDVEVVLDGVEAWAIRTLEGIMRAYARPVESRYHHATRQLATSFRLDEGTSNEAFAEALQVFCEAYNEVEEESVHG